jgi:hypothetical protein
MVSRIALAFGLPGLQCQAGLANNQPVTETVNFAGETREKKPAGANLGGSRRPFH